MMYNVVSQVTQVPAVDRENLRDVEGLFLLYVVDNQSRY